MTNDRMQAAVRRKLDSELSALRTSPMQRESLYATATGGIKVKKKLTVGLVFALILFLTTLTALAMELSGTGVLDWLYRREREQKMNTTIRNANRIMLNLCRGNVAKPVYTQTTHSRGRPIQVYALDFGTAFQ